MTFMYRNLEESTASAAMVMGSFSSGATHLENEVGTVIMIFFWNVVDLICSTVKILPKEADPVFLKGGANTLERGINANIPLHKKGN